MDCLFCSIVNGDIPSDKLYEDELVMAFNDIDPKAPTHILVIPNQHIASCADISHGNSIVTARIFEVIAKLARDLGLGDGFRVVSNTGDSAGQSVKHLHFHLLAGRGFAWPPG